MKRPRSTLAIIPGPNGGHVEIHRSDAQEHDRPWSAAPSSGVWRWTGSGWERVADYRALLRAMPIPTSTSDLREALSEALAQLDAALVREESYLARLPSIPDGYAPAGRRDQEQVKRESPPSAGSRSAGAAGDLPVCSCPGARGIRAYSVEQNRSGGVDWIPRVCRRCGGHDLVVVSAQEAP